MDGVVPVAMEAEGVQANPRHLLIADLPPLGVLAFVDLGAEAKAHLGRGRRDEVNDGHQAVQRPAEHAEGTLSQSRGGAEGRRRVGSRGSKSCCRVATRFAPARCPLPNRNPLGPAIVLEARI